MKLTFIICRILTISLLASAGGMFFLNKEKLSSLRVAIQKSLTEKSSANNLLEKDKEASGNLLNGLFRQRGEVRMITEENISSAEETKKEAEFLTPQMPDLEKKIAELTSDLNDAKSAFSDLEDKVSQSNEKYGPSLAKEKALQEELDELRKSLSEASNKKKALDGELMSHERKRTIAEESFNKRREELLQEIQKPPHLYFGDQIEVEIENIASSGKGIFIGKGRKEGFRESMNFLASVGWGAEKKYFFMKTSLVQDNLSFLETIPTEDEQENNLFDDHEKVLLIRSAFSN